MSKPQTESTKPEKRAEWKRPEVRRIKAGKAEGASGAGGDGFFS